MELVEGCPSPRGWAPRGDLMLTRGEVSAMVRLHQLGWGSKRIATELGCGSNNCF